MTLPLLSLTIACPLVGALVVSRARRPRDTHRAAVVAAGATLVAATTVAMMAHGEPSGVLADPLRMPWGGPAFAVDALSGVLLPFYALLTLVVLVALPRRDRTKPISSVVLLVEAAVLMLYATSDLVLFAVAWTASGLPVLHLLRNQGGARRGSVVAAVALIGSGALVAVAFALLGRMGVAAASPWSIASLVEVDVASGSVPFALLMVAVMLRKGVLPFHSWLPLAFERGPLPVMVLVFNAHIGAYLVARVVVPLLPAVAEVALPWLAVLALLTAAFASLVALAQTSPRRLLAYLAVSQAAFILVGLESPNAEGVTGALVQWLAIGMASTGMAMAYRQVEARLGVRTLDALSGAAARVPRLAASFLVLGLAVAGLPGTLGFVGEDMLVHGVLDAHPWAGVLLVAAAGLNAINVFRFFGHLFLGASAREVPPVGDLRRPEAAALSVLVVAVVATGLFPGPITGLRARAAVVLLPSSDRGLRGHTALEGTPRLVAEPPARVAGTRDER